MASYQKAYICPYRNGRPELESKFYVPFNPSEITVDEAIGVQDMEEDWGNGKGDGKKGAGFLYQNPLGASSAGRRKRHLTLSATLFFNTLTDLGQDSYEDVRQYISRLYPYTNKNAPENGKAEEIYFFWGSLAVAGTLNRMEVKYTVFAPDGRPVRATVGITIVGDYVGEKTGGSTKTASQGKMTGLSEDGALPAMDDPSQWRTAFEGTGNPRL